MMQTESAATEHSSPSDAFFICSLTAVLCFAVLTTWMSARLHLTVAEVGVFALGIGWAVRQMFHPRPVRKTWLLVPITIAAAWGPLQLALGRTVYPFATRQVSLNWLACLVAFFIAAQLLAVTANQRLFRRYVLWFGFALSLISLMQFFTSEGKIFWLFPNGYNSRILGPFVNRDHYSAFVELLLPLAVFQLRRRGKATLYATMAATMYASGIAGASRAGAILTTMLVIVMGLVMSRRYFPNRRLAKLVALAGSVVLFTEIVGWQEVWERLNEPDPFQGRYEFNVASLKMIKQHPGLGYGLGTWPHVYPAHAIVSMRVFANAAHDDWAQWAVEGGLGFAILMAAILVWAVRRAYRFPWAMGIPVVLIHCAAEFPLQVPALTLWFFVMVGWLAAASGPRLAVPANTVTS